ncbi:MAG: hypothetical protein M0R03_21955 [Novosphingobium sp.]|nr:hypothetical protein [Novosphingobium sp.]
MEKIMYCNFKDCGKVLSKKEMNQPSIIHNKREYHFCKKHFSKMLGMIAEYKKAEDRINKNIIN